MWECSDGIFVQCPQHQNRWNIETTNRNKSIRNATVNVMWKKGVPGVRQLAPDREQMLEEVVASVRDH